MPEELTPQQKIAAARERLAAKQAESQKTSAPVSPPRAPTPEQSFPEGDVPDVEVYSKTEDDRAVDSLVDNIDIVAAYIKWCRKSKPDVRGSQKEGIKVSCPNPAHPDKNPSAWLNLDKQVWYCAACDMGGDVHDIAAWHFGYPVPGYRDGINFPNLRRRMAEDLGFVVKKELGGATTFIPPVHEDDRRGAALNDKSDIVDNPDNPTDGPPEISTGTVTALTDEEDEDEWEDIDFYPTLDWRAIVPEQTFLRTWMEQVTVDDVAEEYHFWHGLIALGQAVGRNVTMWDTNPVFPNLFICILGHSGSGKSKAKWLLDQLLVKALPYSDDDFMPTGTKIIGTPASAEALVFAFKKQSVDPSNPKAVLPLEPVRGLVDYNELASLIGRTQRLGNVLPSTLMAFYDMSDKVMTQSRTHGVDEAFMPYCSCHTTTQPKSIKRLLTEDHASSGFLNRWFFVTGKDKEKVALGSVKADVSPCVDPLQAIKGWAGKPRELDWTPAAAEAFAAFFRQRIRPDQVRDKSDMLTRLDLLCKKLILLFAINDRSPSIELEHVERVVKMYEYLVDCYLIPSNQIGNLLQNEIQGEIARMTKDFQEKNGRAMSMRDLNRWTSRKKWPPDMFARTLETMIKLELLEVESVQGKRGPVTRRYRYVG